MPRERERERVPVPIPLKWFARRLAYGTASRFDPDTRACWVSERRM
jgi:hypothetical protein